MVNSIMQRALSGMALVTLLACTLIALSGSPCSGAAAKGAAAPNGENETSAILSVMGYGYKVKVLINGKDAKIKGGKSENKRLFFTDTTQLAEMPQKMRSDFQLLNRGENSFLVEFSRLPGSQGSGLEVTLSVDTQPDQPLFTITDQGVASGKVEKKVTIR